MKSRKHSAQLTRRDFLNGCAISLAGGTLVSPLEALAQGLSMSDLQEAYFNGGAQEKIADWADGHCTENWATIKTHLEAQDWAAARAGLQARSGDESSEGGTE